MPLTHHDDSMNEDPPEEFRILIGNEDNHSKSNNDAKDFHKPAEANLHPQESSLSPGGSSNNSLLKIATVIMISGISSVSMTNLNKLLIEGFPRPFVILVVQNIATILLSFIIQLFNSKLLPMNPFSIRQFYTLLPASLGSFLNLWTSLEALNSMSVALNIVARNSAPLLTTLIDIILFGSVFFAPEYLSLALIALGSIFYVSSDMTFTFTGFGWVVLNTLLYVSTTTMDKKALKVLGTEQTSTGANVIRCAWSIPFSLAILVIRGQMWTFSEIFSLPIPVFICLGLSCIMGTVIGMGYYALATMVSVTGITVANVGYKIMTLIASLLIFNSPFHLYGIIGLSMSFFGVTWFSLMRSNNFDYDITKYVIIVTIILSALYLLMIFR